MNRHRSLRIICRREQVYQRPLGPGRGKGAARTALAWCPNKRTAGGPGVAVLIPGVMGDSRVPLPAAFELVRRQESPLLDHS